MRKKKFKRFGKDSKGERKFLKFWNMKNNHSEKKSCYHKSKIL